jgi:hypothetical protein
MQEAGGRPGKVTVGEHIGRGVGYVPDLAEKSRGPTAPPDLPGAPDVPAPPVIRPPASERPASKIPPPPSMPVSKPPRAGAPRGPIYVMIAGVVLLALVVAAFELWSGPAGKPLAKGPQPAGSSTALAVAPRDGSAEDQRTTGF